jgi:hypothetical protein
MIGMRQVHVAQQIITGHGAPAIRAQQRYNSYPGEIF